MSTPRNFWSRRKAAVADEEASEAKARTEAEAAAERARMEEMPDAEILAELGLKDPDEMQPGDDFSGFLRAAVPDRIRRRALRTLWQSNPVLANLDSLVDYGGDFTDSATVVENLQTAYQVGRGMLKHVEALAEAEVFDDDLPAESSPVAGEVLEDLETVSFSSDTMQTEDRVRLAVRGDEAETAVDPAGAKPSEVEVGQDADLETPRPRRMRFHFLD